MQCRAAAAQHLVPSSLLPHSFPQHLLPHTPPFFLPPCTSRWAHQGSSPSCTSGSASEWHTPGNPASSTCPAPRGQRPGIMTCHYHCHITVHRASQARENCGRRSGGAEAAAVLEDKAFRVWRGQAPHTSSLHTNGQRKLPSPCCFTRHTADCRCDQRAANQQAPGPRPQPPIHPHPWPHSLLSRRHRCSC